MQILIIGENGQVASKLIEQGKFIEGGSIYSVSRPEIDLENEGSIISFLKKYHEGVKDKNSYRIIVNAAAYTNVEGAEDDYEKALKVNALAPKILAEFAKANGYLLIHYSTDYVFNGQKIGDYHEDDVTGPINKYGMSKLLGEQNIISSTDNYLILRTSWVFSEIGGNFVKKIAELLQTRDELKVIDDQNGRPTYSGFIASITYELIKYFNGKKSSEIINLTQPDTTSWYGFANKIKENLVSKNVKLANIIPVLSSEFIMKAERPKNSVLSLNKLEKILPFSIRSWEEDLSKVIDILYESK